MSLDYLSKENTRLKDLLADLLMLAMKAEYRDNPLAKAIRRKYEEKQDEWKL